MKTTCESGSRLPILALCAALMASASLAQDVDDLATRATAAIQASDWGTAAELYSELTTARPEDPTAWYRLGLATLESGGDTATGRAAMEKAQELGFPAGPALFGIAKSHLADGDSETAMATLEKLAGQGPSPFVVSQLGSDDAFAELASNDRFRAIVASLTPCTSEEYRQFDFWLGNWNVVSPQGQPLGTNNVTRAMDGCLLMENWTSALGGQRGMSINYYDNAKGTWSQIYRDNSGNITQWPELIGGLVDSSMVLETAANAQPRARWTWTKGEDGRVRQMAESSTDEGETWSVVWDSYYERVTE